MPESTDPFRADVERLTKAVLFREPETIREIIPAVRVGLLRMQRQELARRVAEHPVWAYSDGEILRLAILACRIASTEFSA